MDVGLELLIGLGVLVELVVACVLMCPKVQCTNGGGLEERWPLLLIFYNS